MEGDSNSWPTSIAAGSFFLKMGVLTVEKELKTKTKACIVQSFQWRYTVFNYQLTKTGQLVIVHIWSLNILERDLLNRAMMSATLEDSTRQPYTVFMSRWRGTWVCSCRIIPTLNYWMNLGQIAQTAWQLFWERTFSYIRRHMRWTLCGLITGAEQVMNNNTTNSAMAPFYKWICSVQLIGYSGWFPPSLDHQFHVANH